MYDATAKIPDGMMGGNTNPPGAFYECLNIETPSVFSFNGEVIEGFK